jgi:hypothetical protein
MKSARVGTCPEKAPSGFEPLFSDEATVEPSCSEPRTDAVDELPEALRRVVQRVSARQREGADA